MGTRMEAKDPRKSSNVEERRKAAIADYWNKQDLSWTRTDSDDGVRYWAAAADYENKRDLSWARKDSYKEIRHWANKQKKDIGIPIFNTIKRLFARKDKTLLATKKRLDSI